MNAPTLSGRGWAYTGATLGGLVSIAANIAHSYVPPQEAPADWAPKPGAVVGAIVWPIFLLVAVEILARVAWPHGPIWQLLRWAGLLPVAVVAALVSYRHLSGLLAFYGEEPIVCVLGPLAVDGLMVMATGAILATGQHQHTEPMSTPALPDNVVRPAPTPPPAPSPDAASTPTDTETVAPQPKSAPTRNRSESRFRPRRPSPPGSPEPTPPAPADRLSPCVRLPVSLAPDPAHRTRPRRSRWPLPSPTPLSPRRSPHS